MPPSTASTPASPPRKGFEVHSPCGPVWFVPYDKVVEDYAKFLEQADKLPADVALEQARAQPAGSIECWFCEQFSWYEVERDGQLLHPAKRSLIPRALREKMRRIEPTHKAITVGLDPRAEAAPESEPEIEPGRCYLHQDGGLYRALFVARNAADLTETVVYEHLWPFESQIWHRPLSEWAGRFRGIAAEEAVELRRQDRELGAERVRKAKEKRRNAAPGVANKTTKGDGSAA